MGGGTYFGFAGAAATAAGGAHGVVQGYVQGLHHASGAAATFMAAGSVVAHPKRRAAALSANVLFIGVSDEGGSSPPSVGDPFR